MEERISISALERYPLPDRATVEAALAAEAERSQRQIVVLDDDPTGVQTVHDVSVYTDWTPESIRRGFEEPGKLFFILTNSRGLTVAETTKVHREIARNVARLLHLSPAQVNFKATTEEGLGFTGREEGICVHATAVLVKNIS